MAKEPTSIFEDNETEFAEELDNMETEISLGLFTQPTQVRPPSPEFKVPEEEIPEDAIGYLRGFVDGKITDIYLIAGKELFVGRSSNCDVIIQGDFLSSKHFVLSTILSKHSDVFPVVLKDLSTNGTLVNGQKAIRNEPVLVSNNTVIDIKDSHQFVFHYIKGDPGKEHMSHQNYIITSRFIGKGAFAKVQFGLDIKRKRQCAVKIISKTRFKLTQDGQALSDEILIMKSIKQANIVGIYDVIDTAKLMCIFLPYVPGGDLHNYIVTQEDNRVREPQACYIFFQVTRALEYLHARHIVHRDIKPENILLESMGEFPRVMITDFGMARVIGNKALHSMCGTFQYLAPEIVKSNNLIHDYTSQSSSQGYGSKVDCWSVGVLLFAMLTGTLPFNTSGKEESELQEMFLQICSGRISFADTVWKEHSHEARHMIRRLVDVDPNTRISMRKAIVDPWINKHFATIVKHYSEFMPFFANLKFSDLPFKSYTHPSNLCDPKLSQVNPAKKQRLGLE